MLEDLGRLPKSPEPMSESAVISLYPRLDATGRLRAGDPGYDDAKMLCGVVVEAKDRTGKNYLFFGGNGRQVSNDHYPYYEFLFEMPDNGEARMVSSNLFYYDVAGVEGFEWYAMFLVFSCLGLAITMPGTIVVLFVRRIRQNKRRNDVVQQD